MQESLKKEHEQIVAWKESPHMTVTQMVRLFGNLGKKVSDTSLRRYLKTHFPKEVKTSIHRETEPGEQEQVDFAAIPGELLSESPEMLCFFDESLRNLFSEVDSIPKIEATSGTTDIFVVL